MIVHEDDPPYVKEEHEALLKFVDLSKFSVSAKQSGEWNDPLTWGGTLPVDGQNVRIPVGIVVHIKGQAVSVPKIIRVDGTLSFARNVDSLLKVDTIVGLAGSVIDLGTVLDPIVNVKAEIVFRDAGPIDIVDDPREWGHGLVSHGKVLIHGKVKTRQSDLQSDVFAGATSIMLNEAPLNWEFNETIVIAGTDKNETLKSYDICKIQSVTGNVVTLQYPLQYSHTLPSPYKIFVIHLDSNIILRSEKEGYGTEPLNPLVKSAAHFMVMHSGVNDSVIKYAKFQDLGRTDKRVPLNSPKFDVSGNRIAETGSNSVGRYACHFHRGKISGNACIVEGCIATSSSGWGFVNHSSNVNFINCVTFDILGSGFVSEICDERGIIENCSTIYSQGTGVSGIFSRSQQPERDFGFEGLGFWLQGPRIKLHNFKTANNHFGFGIWPIGGLTGPPGVIYLKDLVPGDEYLIPGAGSNGAIQSPLGHLDVDGILSFNCIKLTDIEESFPNIGLSYIRNVTSIWHELPSGFFLDYTWNIVFENWNIITINPQFRPDYYRVFNAGFETSSHWYKNCNVRGGGTGLFSPRHGLNRFENCKLANKTNIYLSPVQSAHTIGDNGHKNLRSREAHLTGNVFLPQSNGLIGTRLSWGVPGPTLDCLLSDKVIVEGKQFYNIKQSPGYIPFPVGTSNVPPYLVGLTNQQMLDTYGCCFLNDITPSDAVMNTEYGFLEGKLSTRLGIKYESPIGGHGKAGLPFTAVVRTYQTGVYEPTRITLPTIILNAGWNPLVFEIDGQKYSIHVLGTGVAVPPPLVDSVVVSPISASIEVGKILQLTAIAKDVNGVIIPGKIFVWSSSVPTIATVSASGLVSGVSEGTVTISATVDGKTGISAVNVIPNVPVPKKTITKATINFNDNTVTIIPPQNKVIKKINAEYTDGYTQEFP